MMPRLPTPDRRVWLLIAGIGVLALIGLPISAAAGVRYDYTLQVVAAGGALLGVLSGVIGCFAVLRGQSLLGDGLSHAALPGVGVAFLLAGRVTGALLIGAGIAAYLGVFFISLLKRTTRLKQDTLIGIVLVAWFAAGIALLVFIQGQPNAAQAGLDKFIFGQAASIVESDVRLIAIIGAACLLVIAALWKELKTLTFDPEFASANGMRIRLLDAILSLLIVVAVVLGLQLAGVILMVGMIIAPATAARQWTHKLDQMVVLAGVFGGFAGGAGAIVSALDRALPTGPIIIVIAFLLVILSLLIAPERGILWAAQHRRATNAQSAQPPTKG